MQLTSIFHLQWTAPLLVDKFRPHIEARSNASGLTCPKWLCLLARL